MGQVPDLVVLSGVESDGADQSDAEKGSVSVVDKSCGLWVVFVGRKNVSGGQELLQCSRDEANGVRKPRIWYKVEASCARLHHSFVEAVVYIVTLHQDVFCDSFASFGEDGSGGGCGKHLGVLSGKCKKWYAASAIWVKIVFLDIHGVC